MMNKGCNPFKATAVSCLEDDGESQWEKKCSRNMSTFATTIFSHNFLTFTPYFQVPVVKNALARSDVALLRGVEGHLGFCSFSHNGI